MRQMFRGICLHLTFFTSFSLPRQKEQEEQELISFAMLQMTGPDVSNNYLQSRGL